MRKLFHFLSLMSILLLIGFSTATAQDKPGGGHKNKAKHNQGFVDKNGDGYNDNAPDHDGDGIPNSLDPDWQKLQKNKNKHRFIDLDGDGINDNIENSSNKQEFSHQKGKQQMQKSGGNTGGDQSMQRRHGQRQKHGGH